MKTDWDKGQYLAKFVLSETNPNITKHLHPSVRQLVFQKLSDRLYRSVYDRLVSSAVYETLTKFKG